MLSIATCTFLVLLLITTTESISSIWCDLHKFSCCCNYYATGMSIPTAAEIPVNNFTGDKFDSLTQVAQRFVGSPRMI
jgi:hypothetical protein